MISFETFTIRDGSPIYLQMIEFIERGIASGTIADGEELPSRRVLSATLGVNPGTVQKAYRALEEAGVIESRSGAKSCITCSENLKQKLRTAFIAKDIEMMVQNLKQTGITCEEALSLIEATWKDPALNNPK